MNQYRDFAFVYDKLMDDVDYEGWINYIEQIIKNENAQVKNILELACGTGNITIPLAKKNYDIAGIDISDEMLNVARSKGEEQGIDLVLLEQDISELDFDVTNLDCVLCACDGFNYITYIFDISSFYKLSTVLGDNMYGENREDISYMWQNYFDDEQNLVEMELTFFVADENGKYDKHEERHLQRAYTEEEILDMLEEVGFTDVKVYGDFTFEQPEEDCERVFFVCRK